MKKNSIYVIAEIGINHNGDLDIAKKLIDIAKVAGCDVVKFQRGIGCLCPRTPKSVMRDTPWGKMTYLDYKYKVEFGQNEYDEIDIYCKKRDIQWSASPWDLDSLDFLNHYDIPFIKIPSALITDLELLKATAETNKKVIIFLNSTLEDVEKAVMTIKSVKSNVDFALLHCNSSYPAQLKI